MSHVFMPELHTARRNLKRRCFHCYKKIKKKHTYKSYKLVDEDGWHSGVICWRCSRWESKYWQTINNLDPINEGDLIEFIRDKIYHRRDARRKSR